MSAERAVAGDERDLGIVALLFRLSGYLTIIGVLAALFLRQSINFDLGMLNLLIGRWLENRDPRGHRWAIVVTVLQIAVCPILLLLFAFSSSVPEIKFGGFVVAYLPPLPAAVYVIATTVLEVWEYRVLTRPAINEVFTSKKMNTAATTN